MNLQRNRRPKGRHLWLRAVTLVCLSLGLHPLAEGQVADPMPVAVDLQWLALSRVMTFERGLVAGKRPVVIGVIYQASVRQSSRVMEQFRQAVADNPRTGGLRFQLVTIDIGEGAR